MNMQVTKNTVVTLDYHVTDAAGEVVDEGRTPMRYLHGGYEDIFAKIEEVMEGKTIGVSVMVTLEPQEAFGEYDEDLVEVESREKFPAELEVGMQFEGGLSDTSAEDFVLYRVTDIVGDKVVLDGNHPLAGMTLVFHCTVTALRPASAQEIAVGHIQADDDGA